MKTENAETYIRLSQDELLIAALAAAQEKSDQVTFEDLVAQCFNMFPKKFALHKYSQWPNAVVVNKAWLRCRTDKHLIEGNVAEGFVLTPKGVEAAKKVLARISQALPSTANSRNEKAGNRQTAEGRVVADIEKSGGYRKFIAAGTVDQVSEHELCEVLYTLIESDSTTLKRNFEAVRGSAQSYGRVDLVKFLEELRKKFSYRFTSSGKRGGMLPQA